MFILRLFVFSSVLFGYSTFDAWKREDKRTQVRELVFNNESVLCIALLVNLLKLITGLFCCKLNEGIYLRASHPILQTVNICCLPQ